MGIILWFFILGIVYASIFIPIIYFIINHLGGFPMDDDTNIPPNMFGFALCVGIYDFFASAIGLIEGWRIDFKIGGAVGFLIVIMYWVVFLFFTTKGIAARMYMKIHKLKKNLRILNTNKLSSKEVDNVSLLCDEIKFAEEKISEFVVERCRKKVSNIVKELKK